MYARLQDAGGPQRISHLLAAEAGFAGTNDCFSPSLAAKLFKDRRDVVANRLLPDPKLAGDPPVVEPLRNELKDGVFALGQIVAAEIVRWQYL